jgi:DNA-binding transcriptional regulator YiaG
VGSRFPFDPGASSTGIRVGVRGWWDGERVRALRLYLQLTQQELAQRLGTRQQTISEWEINKHRPRGMSVALLDRLAEETDFRG